MSFLPQGYEEPKLGSGGKYINKFEKGANRFRFLSKQPVMYYEYWTEENKPVRSVAPFDSTPNIRRDEKTGSPDKIRYIWALVVWHYDVKNPSVGAVKILQIRQSAIREGIMALVQDPDWSDPSAYDVTITRTGETWNTTEYRVTPGKEKPAPAEAISELKANPINLEALISNGDPFAKPQAASTDAAETANLDVPPEVLAQQAQAAQAAPAPVAAAPVPQTVSTTAVVADDDF